MGERGEVSAGPAGTAAERWAAALGEWAIPQEILDAAPEEPWSFSPALFAHRAQEAIDSEPGPSRRRAAEALPDGGSVLDVGVGGGAASLPLAPPATLLVGVDQGADMLETFALGAERRGVAHREVQGVWPAAAGEVDSADVVVCHHVVYNVADLVPFASALTARARHRVVVELTGEHPTANLNPLWRCLHGLERPAGPTAEDALAALVEMGLDVSWEASATHWDRPDHVEAEVVAMFRRRLCVGAERDPEIAALLEDQATGSMRRVITLWWDGGA